MVSRFRPAGAVTRARSLVAALLAACALPPEPQGPRSDGLLRQMRACLADPDQRPPCTVVDPGRGFVVIKDDDRAKPYAWLLVPSTDVTGIEDPAVFEAPVAGFWQIGWQVGRRLVPAPPEGLGLAINSVAGRSQNLLHIHVSCVAPEVRAALAARADRPGLGGGAVPRRSRASASTPAASTGSSRAPSCCCATCPAPPRTWAASRSR